MYHIEGMKVGGGDGNTGDADADVMIVDMLAYGTFEFCKHLQFENLRKF